VVIACLGAELGWSKVPRSGTSNPPLLALEHAPILWDVSMATCKAVAAPTPALEAIKGTRVPFT
jgi:hypothetical protein